MPEVWLLLKEGSELIQLVFTREYTQKYAHPRVQQSFLYGIPYTKLSIEDHNIMHNFIEDGGGHIYSITTHRRYSITQYTCGVLFP